MLPVNKIHHVDCLEGLRQLPNAIVQCCVTSPPYWGLRNYGYAGQLGAENSPEEYATALVSIFNEIKRVLKPDGTVWLNLGDAYWGSGKAGKNPAYQAKHIEFGKPSKNATRFGNCREPDLKGR